MCRGNLVLFNFFFTTRRYYLGSHDKLEPAAIDCIQELSSSTISSKGFDRLNAPCFFCLPACPLVS
jgi:hypothetical protein